MSVHGRRTNSRVRALGLGRSRRIDCMIRPAQRSPWAVLALAVALLPAPIRAETVNLSPLVITQLTHSAEFVEDGILVPGTGYTWATSSVTYRSGDVVRVRIEAPAGKMFRLEIPAFAQNG